MISISAKSNLEWFKSAEGPRTIANGRISLSVCSEGIYRVVERIYIENEFSDISASYNLVYKGKNMTDAILEYVENGGLDEE